MSVTEVHEALGSFEFELLGNVPREVLDAITYFGHVAIIPGRIDPLQYGDGSLNAARYVGVVRKKKIADDGRTNLVQDDIRISGVGMNFWLGDEDGKGDVLETEKNFVSASFSNIMSPMASGGLVPPSCSIGTIGTVTGSYTGKHQYQTPRQAIKYVCETLSDNSGPPGTGNGALTFKVSNTAAFSAGREVDMVVTTPTCIIMRKGGTQGEDMTVRALPSTVDMDQDMEDFSTRVVMIAESDGESLATGSADINTIAPGTNVYKNLLGGDLKLTRLVSESETEEQWADTRAELALRKVIGVHRELTLNTEDYDIHGSFNVGDYVWVYEPDAGLFDTNNEVYIRGVRINPIKLQITESSWPVTEGYTVAYRDANGAWYDLTDYIRWDEAQASQIVAGNFARSLEGSSESIALRMGALVTADSTTPNTPVFTTPFTTSSYEDNTGNLKAQVTVVWTTPTNTDASAITDGHFYELHFKRAVETVWSTRTIGWGVNSIVLENLLPDTSYNYRIRAVDINGHQSAWTSSPHTATTGSAPSIPNSVTISSVTSDSSEDGSGVLKAFAQVNWSQPTNTDASAIVDGQSYEVQYKLNSASVWSSVMVAWGTTSTQIHDLNPGVQYNFKVRAIDNSGNVGAFGTTSNHTTNSTPSTPAAPAQPTVTSDSSEDANGVLKAFALVSWTQPLNTNGSAIIDGAYYEVQYKLSAATNWSSQTVPFGTTSTNISNLNPGASADFKVRAVDNSGRVGAFSTTRVHLLSSTPSTPAAPSTTPSGYATSSYEVNGQTRARILATWTTPLNTDASTIIDGAYYELQFKIDGQSNWETRTVSWGTNELLLQDLMPNVTYRFRVRAADTSGRLSAFSSPEGTRTTGNTPTVPNAPTWVTPFTGAVYLDTNGLSKASARLEWNTPTNSDASAITDGDRYEVNVRKSGETEWTVYNVPWGTNTLRLLELSVGTGYEARIRAWDRGGNSSSFSTPNQSFTTLEDTIAPSTPAAPTVATSMVGVQITHNLGKASGGGDFNLEADLAYLEVHKGVASNFTVSDATRIGTIQANAGTLQASTPVVKTFPIGDTTQQWYKVRAVDMSGNVSSASTAASATATLIDTAHISDLTVSKVTAGTISSNWLIGANIGTASSGARVELNTTGFQAFDSSGANTVNITNTGTFSLESPPSQATTPAIEWVGVSGIWEAESSGTDFQINRPPNIQVGDLMLCALATNATTSPSTTAPTGWTVHQTVRADHATLGDTNLVILKKTYALDDPSYWTSTTTTAVNRQTICVAYRGADVASAQFVTTANTATDTTGASTIANTLTNTDANAWCVQFVAGCDDNAGGSWTSSTLVERSDNDTGAATPWLSLASFDSNSPVAASSHNHTATFVPGASTNFQSACAWMAYIKPFPVNNSMSRLELDNTGFRAYNYVDKKTLEITAGTGSIDLYGSATSFNYIEGAQGWRIDSSGGAQFENLGVLNSLGAQQGSFGTLFLNGVSAATVDFYQTKVPTVRVARETSLSLSASSAAGGTLIPWDVKYHERNVEDGAMHNTSTNTSRLKAPVDGIYNVSYVIATSWSSGAPSGTNAHSINIRKNAAGSATGGSLVHSYWGISPGGTSAFVPQSGSFDIALSAGDYLEFFSHTNSTGTTRVIVTNAGSSQACMRYVSPLDGPGTGGTNITIVEFPAIGCRSFTGGGFTRPIAPTEWAYQGQYDSNYGNQKSVLTFDYAAIATALSGKTITKCTLRYHVQHSYYGTMDVSVGTHNSTVAPASVVWPPTGLNANRILFLNQAQGTTYVQSLGVGIGQEFQGGTAKGIVFGPGPSTIRNYYGYMVGYQPSIPAKLPLLSFTYT